MKKSIITMIAVVAIAAINLNVYLDDAEAFEYERTSDPCFVQVVGSYEVLYDCELYYSLPEEQPEQPEQPADDPGDNPGSGSGNEHASSNDSYETISEDCSYEVSLETGYWDDQNGDGIYETFVFDTEWVWGTTTWCSSGGSDSECEESSDCEDEL